MAQHLHTSFKKIQTLQDRISDMITKFAGSMRFVYFHSVWFLIWIIFNLGLLGSGFVFDQFPFGLLTLIVSLEAIFLSTFVMISQNQQAKMAELRSELDYETDVKAEKEIEVIMETLQRIAQNANVDVKDLAEKIKMLHQEEKHLIGREKKTQKS